MIKKIVAGLSSAALFLGAVTPMFAATVEVSGNGSGSTNKVYVKESCTQSVYQSSKTKVGIDLDLSANTGKNKANGNTGGDVNIDTGDATNSVVIGVAGGSNEAVVPDCCCGGENGATDVTVSDNGTDSYNKVKAKKYNTTTLTQKSKTKVWVEADVKANTGKNKAKNNTGSGVEVKTGNSENGAEIGVEGGSNTL